MCEAFKYTARKQSGTRIFHHLSSQRRRHKSLLRPIGIGIGIGIGIALGIAVGSVEGRDRGGAREAS